MAKINKEDLTPEQLAQIEAKKQAEQNTEQDVKSKNAGRKTKTDQVDTEETGGKDAKGKAKPTTCDHEYVFHASQTYQDRPGKKFVYRRCAKCNDLKLTVEDVKGK